MFTCVSCNYWNECTWLIVHCIFKQNLPDGHAESTRKSTSILRSLQQTIYSWWVVFSFPSKYNAYFSSQSLINVLSHCSTYGRPIHTYIFLLLSHQKYIMPTISQESLSYNVHLFIRTYALYYELFHITRN